MYNADYLRRQKALPVVPLISLLAGFAIVPTAFAQQGVDEAANIDWLELSMGLFAGLALFLAGLEVLSEGLKKRQGARCVTSSGRP
ncbi:MAG: hypothetical protein JSW50_04545 [Candidatus Latescibacterota bacterium]|nr:MAG: hypothetical protein JSW50_04545 [Candidatus Latescibacterota bacterium]